MKSLQEIIGEIWHMDAQEAEEQGVVLITEWMKAQQMVLKTYSITDKLTPYLSENAKAFFEHRSEFSPEYMRRYAELGCYLCCVGVTVERTMMDLQDGEVIDADSNWVREEEYRQFGQLLSWATRDNIFVSGLLMDPFAMPMAVISAGRRVMLMVCTLTPHKSLDYLQGISNMFTSEGVLPPLLKDIHYNGTRTDTLVV